jgi:glycosyltransferase involved in cell wall biosynthesis
MRILFVVSGLGLGGAEKQVVLLSREMSARGHRVCIFTLNHRNARIGDLDDVPVEIVLEQKRAALDPTVLFRLRRRIKTWKPDVVHGFLFDGNVYSRIAALGVPAVVLSSERSDNYVLSLAQRLGNRLTRTFADGVVANSRAGADFASRTQHIPAEHCSVVWNGIDLAEVDARMRTARQSETPAAAQIWPGEGIRRVCMVGSIKPAKDYPLALLAMRRLADRDPSWRFICVGGKLFNETSEEQSRVFAEFGRLGLDKVLSFVGPRPDALEIIGTSDVLLMTSRREGFPNVVLEAMACGTPVASTDYSDVKQILPNRWQVAQDRDADLLADIVERCMAERDRVAASQRQWVETNGTIAASTSSLLALYERYLQPVAHALTRAG